MISYTVDSSEMDRETSKHEGGLDVETILALEGALTSIFQITQAAVHIHSGRLRASGRMESHASENTWTGEIKYGGGASRVDYAWYEERRRGTHDFMLGARNSDGAIGVAFRTGMD